MNRLFDEEHGEYRPMACAGNYYTVAFDAGPQTSARRVTKARGSWLWAHDLAERWNAERKEQKP